MRVSIVVPTLNQSDYLERTLQSLISQNGDIEVIVMDGGSTDGSLDILKRYEGQIADVVVASDDGQADALVKGFKRATGDVVGYLNSDDVLLPGTIEFVSRFFSANRKVDVLYGHRVFINEHDEIVRFWILPPHNRYCMRRWDFIPQETCFWRREVMDEAGGIDPGYKFALDYDLFVRMMVLTRFKRVHRFLAAFREHDASKTSSLMTSIGNAEIDRVRRRYGIRISKLGRVVGKLLWLTIIGQSTLFRAYSLRRGDRTLGAWLKSRGKAGAR